MNKAQGMLSHLIMILGLMFLVFLILDQFNPMMNFIDNDISRWLLAGFCGCGIVQSILQWAGKDKR